MKKITTISVCIILALVMLSGCARETGSIQLGTMPTYSASIYAVGIEQGFFEEAGVNVDLKVFRSARDRDSAATAGELDGFMTDIMGAINLNTKGFPVVMTSREYDDFGVMAGPEIEIGNMDAPKIGLAENTVTEFIVDTYLQETNEKVNIAAVPDRMGALLTGNLDYGVYPQPFMGIIMGKQGQVVFNTASVDFHPVVLVFGEDYISESEDSVKAFYEGYAKTVNYMKTADYDEYKSALVTHGLATQETVDFYSLPVEKYGLNEVDEKDVEVVAAWMTEKGLLGQTLNFNDISSTEYLK